VVINYKKITFFCDEVEYKFNMSVVLDIKNMLGDSVVFLNMISPNVCSPRQIAKKRLKDNSRYEVFILTHMLFQVRL